MPGKLTGTALNDMVLRNIRERNTSVMAAESRIASLRAAIKNAPKGMAKNLFKRQLKDTQRYRSTLKSEISLLKRNIK